VHRKDLPRAFCMWRKSFELEWCTEFHGQVGFRLSLYRTTSPLNSPRLTWEEVHEAWSRPAADNCQKSSKISIGVCKEFSEVTNYTSSWIYVRSCTNIFSSVSTSGPRALPGKNIQKTGSCAGEFLSIVYLNAPIRPLRCLCF